MVIVDKVKFEVLVQIDPNQELYEVAQEYDDPSPNDGQSEPVTVKYIEAKTGNKFKARYTFLAGFNLFEANVLNNEIDIDNGTVRCAMVGEPKRYTKYNSTRKLKNDPLHMDEEFEIERTYKSIDGRDYSVSFAFARANLDEEVIRSTQTTKGSAGSIKLAARRSIHKGYLPTPTLGKLKIDKILNKKSIALGVDHTFDISDKRSVDLSTMRWWDLSPLTGPNGERIKVEFRYRSKKALQEMGCIEKPPETPETAAHRAEVDRLLVKIERREAELRQLRETTQSASGSHGNRDEPIDLTGDGTVVVRKRTLVNLEDYDMERSSSLRRSKRVKPSVSETIELD